MVEKMRVKDPARVACSALFIGAAPVDRDAF